MPLLDHFHPPLLHRRHWESFHALWAAQIVRMLNRGVLPPKFYAEAQTHYGSRIEVDVATLEGEAEARDDWGSNGSQQFGGGGTAAATAIEAWAPPATALVMPAVFPEEFAVQVYSTSGGPTLVASIEFASPGNKDRPETRRAFAAKCLSYLQQGIGLLIVDVVTEYRANLHDGLIDLMEQPESFRYPAPTPIYTSAFRPRRLNSGDQIEVWRHELAIGQPLPTMPLALRNAVTVPVHLEAAYEEVRIDSRL